jgi:nucleoside-diphosphate-sugar epimerase
MNHTDSPAINCVLVTGAAGFIASRVAHQLLDQGVQVHGIDNLNNYYDPRLKQHRLKQLLARDGFTFNGVDIEQHDLLRECFGRYPFDAVLNLAARAGVRYSTENPYVYYRTNVMGSLNVLELMREFKVPKYVLASTSSLYAGQPMPFSEELPVNEPISPYAASKKAAEVMAYAHHHLYKIDVSICRYFTVYGPAGRPDMAVYRFIRWIEEGTPIEVYGDGSQGRDFTYVDDIAAGTIAAMKPLGFETINLGGGQNPVSLIRLIEMIESLLGKKAILKHLPAHVTDLKETWADVRKASQYLDWQPQISLEEGLQATVKWFRDDKELAMSIDI